MTDCQFMFNWTNLQNQQSTKDVFYPRTCRSGLQEIYMVYGKATAVDPQSLRIIYHSGGARLLVFLQSHQHERREGGPAETWREKKAPTPGAQKIKELNFSQLGNNERERHLC